MATVLSSGQFVIATAAGGWLADYTVSRDSNDLVIDLDLDSNTNETHGDYSHIKVTYNGVTQSLKITVGDGAMQIKFEGGYVRTENTVTFSSGKEDRPKFGVPHDPWYDTLYTDTSYDITWEMEKNNLPVAGFSVSQRTAVAGEAITVSWSPSDADGEEVTVTNLVRHVKKSGSSSYDSFTVLSGTITEKSYNDTFPEDAVAMYYSLTLDDGYDSVTRSSPTVAIVNAAPTTPGKPSIPSEIYGGSQVTVSWSASSDEDGNLEGYILERSTDGGSTWTQVYQGSSESTRNAVPSGAESVMYRVKAYDSLDAESAYATGSQVLVNNNSAPAAPASITVPVSIIGGEEVVVTWTAATDPDGDSVTYRLERATNGSSSWETIYTGSALSYTDTASSDWSSVTYRVCTVDANGGVSGYVTSNERTVITNFPPTLTLTDAPDGMDWGVIAEAPSISYSASDPDGDEVTISTNIDGKFATFKTNKSPNIAGVYDLSDIWNQVLNGEHVLTVEAGDGKEIVSQSVKFTKKVTECFVTLKEPMTSGEQIQVCAITVNGSFPADCELLVEVTNNALDDSPVWEDATAKALSGMNHAFANAAQTNGWAFNFRISAKEGSSGEGGYITSVQGGFQ